MVVPLDQVVKAIFIIVVEQGFEFLFLYDFLRTIFSFQDTASNILKFSSINLDKYEFSIDLVEYLGFVVGLEGVKIIEVSRSQTAGHGKDICCAIKGESWRAVATRLYIQATRDVARGTWWSGLVP